jgi:hypothetical protein
MSLLFDSHRLGLMWSTTQVANPLFKSEDHGHDSLDESQFNAKSIHNDGATHF